MSDRVHIPLSRPVNVVNLPPKGIQVSLKAELMELQAIAQTLDLPLLEALSAEFSLISVKGSDQKGSNNNGSVRVIGHVYGLIHQTCVVSLEPFPVTIEEPVDLEFAPSTGELAAKPKGKAKLTPVAIPQASDTADEEEIDPPDLILNGEIDLGVLMTEFLALALDPFPRKPGIVFEFEDRADQKENPFAALVQLKPDA